jgi:hypothetical protein
MKVVPVNFGTEHKQLLSHLHVVTSKGYLAIPEKHDILITSLRTAVTDLPSLKVLFLFISLIDRLIDTN